MKKILLGIFTAIIVCSVTACGGNKASQPEENSVTNVEESTYNKESDDNEEATNIPETNADNEDNSNVANNTSDSETTDEETEGTGLSDEFVAAMDTYEQFFNDYCDFMVEYANSDDVLSMSADYAEWMKNYAENMEALENWESEDMTEEELNYYLDVMTRINKRLLEVADSY